MSVISRTFTSLGEFISYVKPNSKLPGMKNASRDNDMTFRGTRNFTEAMTLCREGWLPEEPSMDEMTRGIQDKIRSIMGETVVPQLMEFGGAVDIVSYLSGERECMMTFPIVPAPSMNHSVVIVINIGAHSGIKTRELLTRGAAICALVQILAEIGFNAEIWVGDAATSRATGRVLQHAVLVKPASDPIDIRAIAFTMAHPSMLRRLMFSAREQQPSAVRNEFRIYAGGGYGYACEMDVSDMDPTLYIPQFDRSTDYDANWVISLLRQCGITFDD